jgi:hypothetical protein
MKSPPADPPASDESPRVPGFRTWRGVYLFVIGCFILCVVLLAILSRAFS